MRSLLISFGFLACALISDARTLPKTDSLQIASMIDDWNRAWEIKDYKLATRWYSTDAIFTNAFGDTKYGQKEVKEL